MLMAKAVYKDCPDPSDEDDIEGGAMYCEVCGMWVPNPTKFEIHKSGKKHLKNLKPKRANRGEHQSNKVRGTADLPLSSVHPYLSESGIVAHSRATDVLDEVKRGLPSQALQQAQKSKTRNIQSYQRHKERRARARAAMCANVGELQVRKACAMCGASYGKRCSGCYQVRYCSRRCQKDHWLEHKPACEWLAGLLDDGPISRTHSQFTNVSEEETLSWNSPESQALGQQGRQVQQQHQRSSSSCGVLDCDQTSDWSVINSVQEVPSDEESGWSVVSDSDCSNASFELT